MTEIRIWLEQHPVLAIVIAVASTIIAMTIAHDVIKKFYLRLLQLVAVGMVGTGLAAIAGGKLDLNALLLSASCVASGGLAFFAASRLDRQFQTKIRELEGRLKKSQENPLVKLVFDPGQDKARG